MNFSDLPALIQQAQNSSHALASQMNEIEAAMQVSFWFQQCKDMAEAVKLTVASQPACSHYMETIGAYVRLYGGGEDFPVMKVLDGISKLYGSNACIGEEFMEHVTFLAEGRVLSSKLHQPQVSRFYIQISGEERFRQIETCKNQSRCPKG